MASRNHIAAKMGRTAGAPVGRVVIKEAEGLLVGVQIGLLLLRRAQAWGGGAGVEVRPWRSVHCG